jgi:hypothetical protein
VKTVELVRELTEAVTAEDWAVGPLAASVGP